MIRALAFAAVLVPALARADSTDRCIAESEAGQRLVLQRRFVAAQPHLVACGRAECPAAISRDCIERFKQAQASAASVVLSARRGDGSDAGARVAIDAGAATAVTGAAVWLDPGPHRFRFEPPTGEPIIRDVTVEEGARLVRIAVTFEPAAPAATGATEAATGATRRHVGVALGVAGLAGLAGGAAFGLVAHSRQSSEHAACASPTDCPDRAAAQRDYDSAHRFATASTIAVIAGGALVAAGAVLWLTAPRADHPNVAVSVVPAGVFVHGAF